MTPSASCTALKDASGSVVPCARIAASPIGTVVNFRPSPNASSAARNTPSVAAVISGPMPSPSITTRCVIVLGQALPDFSGARGRSSHQEAHVGLSGHEADALSHQLALAIEIAVTAEPGKLVVLLRRRDHAIHRRHDLRAAELAGQAHRREQVVAADVHDIDAVDRAIASTFASPSTVSIMQMTSVESLSAGTAWVSGTAR